LLFVFAFLFPQISVGWGHFDDLKF